MKPGVADVDKFDWEGALIERAKIVDYLLNDDHPVGGPKSAFFRRFGFRPDQWEALADALRSHAKASRLPMLKTTPFGIRVVATGPLQGIDGRRAIVVSV